MGIKLGQQPVIDQREEHSKPTELKHTKVKFSKPENSWEKQNTGRNILGGYCERCLVTCIAII